MNDLLVTCAETSEFLSQNESIEPIALRLKREKGLRLQAQRILDRLHSCGEVYAPAQTGTSSSSTTLKAVAWNVERGKYFDSLLHVLQNHPELKEADLYFFTEVDWGMARSGNRNVTADLAAALGLYGYFAPSYYNFTKGHGSERHLPGKNTIGLHGKAILSRYPLQNLRVVAMPNATDILNSKESRIGEKRALIGQFPWRGKNFAVGCAHLDAFSSPRARAEQLKEAAKSCQDFSHALIAGDWNTNSLNSSSGGTILRSVLRQFFSPGPQKMIREHFPFPERIFDRPLFSMLKSHGFDVEDCNEAGKGTFDVFSNDAELGQMANDQYPRWLLKWINRLVEKSGGVISLKLDWFAAKNLRPLEKKVVKLTPNPDHPNLNRPSDHRPILLTFALP